MYCHRPARSRPTACSLPCGDGLINTSDQAGGIPSRLILATSWLETLLRSARLYRNPRCAEPTRRIPVFFNRSTCVIQSYRHLAKPTGHIYISLASTGTRFPTSSGNQKKLDRNPLSKRSSFACLFGEICGRRGSNSQLSAGECESSVLYFQCVDRHQRRSDVEQQKCLLKAIELSGALPSTRLQLGSTKIRSPSVPSCLIRTQIAMCSAIFRGRKLSLTRHLGYCTSA
jgi:hypothetical protein